MTVMTTRFDTGSEQFPLGRSAMLDAIEPSIALAVSGDLPLARLSGEVRRFRIYGGASEVHSWASAKRSICAAKKTATETAA
ncbi:hypothetical protein [Rhodococcus erythropolis]